MLIKNVVVISDTHFGCQYAVCPPRVALDGEGCYKASPLQNKLWKMWKFFWNDFVPKATRGEDYILVHNGDMVEGVHHKAVSQISQNMQDQRNLAIEVMSEQVNKPKCKVFYQVRGTEAHVGPNGSDEEAIAKALGAKKGPGGKYSRWELFLMIGKGKKLLHFTHHIGTTNSAAYETTALGKEMVEAYTEAGKQGFKPPDVLIRSHRHRGGKVEMPGANHTNAITVVTPPWQSKTPFSYKGALGRSAQSQVGGIIIREGEEVPLYVRDCTFPMPRPRIERYV